MVDNTTRRITGCVTALKRKNLDGALRALWDTRKPHLRKGSKFSSAKPWADNWLELQYGWKPLLADIHEAMEAYSRFLSKDTTVQSVSASASHKDFESEVLRVSGTYFQDVGKRSVKTSTRSKFTLRYAVDDHLKAFMSQTGFTNPINLAWEVIPYSFVADWFLPVGPYLENVSAFGGMVFAGGTEVSFTRRITTFVANADGTPGGNPNNGTRSFRGFYQREAILLDRSALAGFPSMVVPEVKSPFSIAHVLNGIALMVGTLVHH